MSETSLVKRIFSLAKNRVKEFFADFWSFLKNVLRLFRQNFKEVMLFILFCSVFTMVVTSALKAVVVEAMMKVSGETYIVPENLRQVFLSPASMILILIFAIVMTFLSLFEIAGLIHAFSMGQKGLDTNIPSMFMAGLRACRKALDPRN